MAFITRPSLLNRIKEGDQISWYDFYDTYKPLIWLMGSDYKLTQTEKEDLVQNVMTDFFNIQGKFTYDPSKGSFRSYFRMIIKARIFKTLKARKYSDDDVDIENIDIPDESSNEEDEWQAFALSQALNEVMNTLDARQVQAFIRCKLEGQKPADVAKSYGVSQATIYNDCNFVMKRITEIIKSSNLL